MKRLRLLYAVLTLVGLVLVLANGASLPAAAQATTPTVVPTVNAVNRVLIWWPSAVYPDEDSTAMALLNQHVARYEREKAAEVTIRVKRTEGTGSIISTLNHASVVAPSVVPDLALVRRAELLAAVNGSLLTPIDLTRLEIDDLFASGLSLGTMNGTQYGIPYLLDVQHAVYRRSIFEEQPQTLAMVLDAGQSFYFPANAGRGVNSTVLTQYLSLGGRLVDDTDKPLVDAAPLAAVLSYYEVAAKRTLITPTWLEYNSPEQYYNAPTGSKAALWLVNATNYLSMFVEDTQNLAYSPVPTVAEAKDGVSSVDGWVWVITADDPAQRQQALDVIQWLMESERQGAFTSNLGWLPSRQSSLQTWNTNYAMFAATLLDEPSAPPLDEIDPKVTAALQTAFEDVVNGKKTAEVAAQAASIQVGQQQ